MKRYYDENHRMNIEWLGFRWSASGHDWAAFRALINAELAERGLPLLPE